MHMWQGLHAATGGNDATGEYVNWRRLEKKFFISGQESFDLLNILFWLNAACAVNQKTARLQQCSSCIQQACLQKVELSAADQLLLC